MSLNNLFYCSCETLQAFHSVEYLIGQTEFLLQSTKSSRLQNVLNVVSGLKPKISRSS